MFEKILIVLIFIVNTQCQYTDDSIKDHIERNFKKFGQEVINIVDHIKQKISNVFMGAVNRIEGRRKKIQNGLNKFIDETIYDRFTQTNKTKIPFVSENFDMKSNAPRMITDDGYKVQTHTAITQDEYIINLQRIIPKNSNIGSRVVLLLHGLLGSCDDWLLLGPNKALPYLLSEAGYDVWLANARGTHYSNTHTTWALDSPQFWNFTVNEIGLYDLSTAINYIRDTTRGKVKINFVGHSMGTTALLILLSVFPAYNSILASATLLAPLAFMYHAKGPLRLITQYRDLSSLSTLGEKQFLRGGAFPQEVIEQFCGGDESFCLNPLILMADGGWRIANEKLRTNILKHVPAVGSTKTIIHYGQLLINGQFMMYDYGPDINPKMYSSSTPPKYDLNHVTVPLIIFSAKNDWLSTSPDISTLIQHLPSPNPVVHYVVTRNDFSHTDFVWGEDAPESVYDLVISIMYRYNLIDNYKDIENVY